MRKLEIMKNNNLMEKIVSLCKRRGFIYPSSEIYGGLANTWDYGPLGVELKNNIKNLWWKKFVQERDDVVGLDSALIMNPNIWEASGHLKEFVDPLVECEICHERFRWNGNPSSPGATKEMFNHISQKHPETIGKYPESVGSVTGFKLIEKNYTKPKKFNLMFKTFIGPAEDTTNIVYLRPETAQGIFVNFKNILDTTRLGLPFGIAQIGKAFRNEITPGNFIFRTREFEQMEIEYFIYPPELDGDWEKEFEKWRKEMQQWMTEDLGLEEKNIHELEVPEEERAHYSKKTIDFEYKFPFGQKELYGLAYRTDFDLKNHEKFSGKNLKYKDPQTGKEFWPHVIEPSLGVDRTILAVLINAYAEEKDRVVLKLKPRLAPYKVAVFPLLANKPDLLKKAREIYKLLKATRDKRQETSNLTVAWDDRGNIGKRYYAQDEIGTPYCITVDFESLEKDDVTVRDRDTAKQERIKIKDLSSYLTKKISDA